MIERIRCIPVICPWGLKFYSLSEGCAACYRIHRYYGRRARVSAGSASEGAPEGLAGGNGNRERAAIARPPARSGRQRPRPLGLRPRGA